MGGMGMGGMGMGGMGMSGSAANAGKKNKFVLDSFHTLIFLKVLQLNRYPSPVLDISEAAE